MLHTVMESGQFEDNIPHLDYCPKAPKAIFLIILCGPSSLKDAFCSQQELAFQNNPREDTPRLWGVGSCCPAFHFTHPLD